MSMIAPTTLATTEPTLLQKLFFGADNVFSTENVAHSDGLFFMIWWFSVFFFVLLMGLMLWWTVRYRRRPGVPPPVSPSHNTALEVFWTVVPSSSLLVIFVLGFQGYMAKLTPKEGAFELNVSAWKWGWSIDYPNGATSFWNGYLDDDLEAGTKSRLEYPIFVLAEDTDYKLKMISQDVIHAFWIPDLRIKMDVYPNRYTGYAITTPKLDADDQVTLPNGQTVRGRRSEIYCAEYCGSLHSEMAAILYILPKDVYRTILTEEWGESRIPLPDLGETVYKQRCATCHSVDGSPGTGPTWAGGTFGGRSYGYAYPVEFDNGSSLASRDDDYIREAILDPGRVLVAGYPGQMASFQGQLSERQLEAVILYYKLQTTPDRRPNLEEILKQDQEAQEASGEQPASEG